MLSGLSLQIFTLLNIAIPNPAEHLWQYELYLHLHVLALLINVVILFRSFLSKPSKAQSAVIMFECGSIMYIIGFIEEIMSDTAEGYFISIITQYAGEFLVFIALVLFVSELCHVKVPRGIYIFMTVFSLLSLFCIATTRSSGLFYNSIGVDALGLFSKPDLDYYFMFFVTVTYIFAISCWVLYACLSDFKNTSPFQKKRLGFLIASLFLCWLPYVLTLTGVTGGYEIPALGITLAGVCLYMCFYQYGSFDSQVLASTNALEHGRDGILVVDSACRVRYQNKIIAEVFGNLEENYPLKNHPVLGPVFTSDVRQYQTNGRIYDLIVDPFMEGNYVVGQMLWVKDETERYHTMKKIQEAAIRDNFTGLYNRNKLQSLVETEIEAGRLGAFVMFDMDNFKSVNDTFGHQTGDAVLMVFANVLKKYGEESLYSCRLGGDEFCIFIRRTTDKQRVSILLTNIFRAFDDELQNAGYTNYTSLSSGGIIPKETISFKKLYAEADKLLYVAKTSGKRKFLIEETGKSE